MYNDTTKKENTSTNVGNQETQHLEHLPVMNLEKLFLAVENQASLLEKGDFPKDQRQRKWKDLQRGLSGQTNQD